MARAVCCDVAAVGRVRVPVEQLPELRRCPGPVSGPALSATFLKNADEQTVYGLTAVYLAVQDAGLAASSFGRWGVVAAPRKLGRSAMAQSIPHYAKEGAWGMSPHLIPNRSLHCISGAISCALKMKGPNVSVGDGPSEALPTALAMMAQQSIEGIWLVLTGFDPELAPDCSGSPVSPSIGVGVALALMPARSGWQGLRLSLEYEQAFGPPVARRAALDLFRLIALLDAPVVGPRSVPLQDFGASGRLALRVEGEALPTRRDPAHVPAVQAPHTAEKSFSSPVSSPGLEAAR